MTEFRWRYEFRVLPRNSHLLRDAFDDPLAARRMVDGLSGLDDGPDMVMVMVDASGYDQRRIVSADPDEMRELLRPELVKSAPQSILADIERSDVEHELRQTRICLVRARLRRRVEEHGMSASARGADAIRQRILFDELDEVARALIRRAERRDEMYALLDAVASAVDEVRYADARAHLTELHYLALHGDEP